jgi:menaquinone-dependent protoporphyrinogen IX oxidase
MVEQESNGNGKNALIVYSSLAGCTEEVALKIKEKLENSSINTEIIKINDKDQCKALFQRDLGQFTSVLLGSSITAGKVHKNIHKLLAKLESTSSTGTKLGFYICCMKARTAEKIIEAKNQYIEPSLKKHAMKFSLVDAFGGKLDFSPMSSMKPMMKGLLKKIMAKDNPELGEIESKVYDFRDWQQIEEFASAWANIIANP